jgi:uncharacterized protein (DUF2147 family)
MTVELVTPAQAGVADGRRAAQQPSPMTPVFAGVTALLLLASIPAFAQTSPVGLWRNIDDGTGEAKAEIRIVEANGQLSGRIEKTLRKDAKPDAKCDKCEDDRKDKPMVGLEIIRGNKILDPENGKEYRLELTPIEGGRKLQVRGFFGPFYRTQFWVRAQ